MLTFLGFMLAFSSRPDPARADSIDWGRPYIGPNNIWWPENNFFVLPEHNNMPVATGYLGWADVSTSQPLKAIWRKSRYYLDGSPDGQPYYVQLWSQSSNGGQPLPPGE